MHNELTLRPIQEADLPLLLRIYGETRRDLRAVDWSNEQKEVFLTQQFQTQHRYYHQQFPEATFDLIVERGEPIGRLYVRRTDEEIHILDIALLPEHRGRGIGSSLLRDLLREAEAHRLSVRISVEPDNPAIMWYRRLGFRQTGENGFYQVLRWTAEAVAGPALGKSI